MAKGAKFGENVAVVVDFAVEDDPHLAVGTRHRLLTAGQIDDGEPAMGHHRPMGRFRALLVGTAVGKHAVHRPERVLAGEAALALGVDEYETAHGKPLIGSSEPLVQFDECADDRVGRIQSAHAVGGFSREFRPESPGP